MTPRRRKRPHEPILACAIVSASVFTPSAVRADEAPTFADRDVSSDEGPDCSFALLVNPVAMVYGVFGLETDFVAASAVVIAFDVEGVRTPSWAPEGQASGVSVGGAVLAYPWRGAFHGCYFGARLGFVRLLREPLLHVDGRVDVAEFGVSAGWQWTWDYGFSVRVGVGPLVAIGAAPPSVSPELLTGPFRFALSADASVGWAF